MRAGLCDLCANISYDHVARTWSNSTCIYKMYTSPVNCPNLGLLSNNIVSTHFSNWPWALFKLTIYNYMVHMYRRVKCSIYADLLSFCINARSNVMWQRPWDVILTHFQRCIWCIRSRSGQSRLQELSFLSYSSWRLDGIREIQLTTKN